MTDWITALPMYNVTPVLADLWRSLVHDTMAALDDPTLRVRIVEPDDIGPTLTSLWTRPDLLLSQTCGYPLLRVLPSSIQIVATPIFDIEGCEGPHYSSVLVVSRAALARGATSLAHCRGMRAAYNEPHSNSGMNLLRRAVAPLARDGRFFSAVVETGSHRSSLQALIDDAADIAAIDCVTFAFAQTIPDIANAGLTVIGFTKRTAGLPLIASAAVTPDVLKDLRQALNQALEADPARARTLHLKGFARLTRDDYAEIGAIEDEAIAMGYSRLA